MLSLSTNNREMKSESCLSLAMASQAFKESRQEYFISVQKPCIYSMVKVILINICQDVHRKQALPAPLGRLHHLPPWQRPGWFQKLFSSVRTCLTMARSFQRELDLASCSDILWRLAAQAINQACANELWMTIKLGKDGSAGEKNLVKIYFSMKSLHLTGLAQVRLIWSCSTLLLKILRRTLWRTSSGGGERFALACENVEKDLCLFQ